MCFHAIIIDHKRVTGKHMTTRVLKAHLQNVGVYRSTWRFLYCQRHHQQRTATNGNYLAEIRYCKPVFVVLLVSQGLLTLPHYRDLGRYTLISLPPLLYFACMIFSLQTTSAINSSALYTTVPLMSMVMSVVFLNAKSTWPVVAALLLGILGALLIILKVTCLRFYACR